MVTRTAEHMLVSEDHLADAIGIIEAVLQEQDITADIDVTLDRDLDDPDAPELNVLVALVREPIDIDRLVDVVPLIGQRLSSAGLLMPAIPLMFDVDPAW